eukprot:TRINITY_DN10616_c0_g1_i2.p1 TRINITY_DN10616_c0_g1~~TRINITY_DN10616_c0_g1_i2.p1  ORF type:complete len:308 (-),score=69.32 TRINITY_DN10616_c0_g1_i2:69-992(-)
MEHVRVEALIPMSAASYFDTLQQTEYDVFAANEAENLEGASEDERLEIDPLDFYHYVPTHHVTYTTLPNSAVDPNSKSATFLTPQAKKIVQRKVSLRLHTALPWAVRRLLGLEKMSVFETRTYLRHRVKDLPEKQTRNLSHPVFGLLNEDELGPDAEFFEILFVSKPPVLQEQLSCYGSLYLIPIVASSQEPSCRMVNICYPQSHVPGFSTLLLQIFSREIKYAYSLVPNTVRAWLQTLPDLKHQTPAHDIQDLLDLQDLSHQTTSAQACDEVSTPSSCCSSDSLASMEQVEHSTQLDDSVVEEVPR